MRFACESCQTRYNLADEKVRGRILKIRCKSCNHVMVVRDPALVAPAAAPAFEDAPTRNLSAEEAMRLAAASRPAEEAATRVFSANEVEKLVRSAAAGTPGPEAVGTPGPASMAPVATPGPASLGSVVTPGPAAAPPKASAARGAPSWEAATPVSAMPPAGALTPGPAASADRAAELRHAIARKPAVPAVQATAPARADSPAEEWWAMSGGAQVGPMSRAELLDLVASGELQPRNYVWREGMENWQRFESVEELNAPAPWSEPELELPAAPVPAELPAPDPAAFLDSGFSAEARLADAIAEDAWVEKQPVEIERPSPVAAERAAPKPEGAKKRSSTLRMVQLAGAGGVLAGAFAAGAFFFLPAGGGKAASGDGSPLVTGPVRLADFDLPDEAPLDRTAVGEALATRLDGFARCVQDHAPRGARPKRVVLRAVIAPAGNVTTAQVTGGNAEGDFAACLADRARDIKFPSFKGEPVELSFPLAITED